MQKIKLNKYSTIFFDLYHTLTYPGLTKYKKYEWDVFNVTKEFWAYHSMKTYHDRGIGKVSRPEKIIENILLSANIPQEELKVKEAISIRINKFRDCLIHVPKNILKTVRHLSSLNKQLCLISNSDVIDKMGWDLSPLKDYFKCAIFSCDVGILKPDERIYKRALEQMETIPEKSLYIGDGGSHEFEGAKRLSIDTLMTIEFIKDLWPEKIDEIRKHADFIISKLDEIIQ